MASTHAKREREHAKVSKRATKAQRRTEREKAALEEAANPGSVREVTSEMLQAPYDEPMPRA